MKIIRFISGRDEKLYGNPDPAAPGKARVIEEDILTRFSLTDRVETIKKILPPIEPPNILVLGFSYGKHAGETESKAPESPVLFIKGQICVSLNKKDFYNFLSNKIKKGGHAMKKSRRDFLKNAGVAALGAGVVLSASKRGYAQTKPALKWKAQCLWSQAEGSYKAFEDFCKRVFAMTDGRLEITPFPSGTIVPNVECADAVKNNVMQAMHQASVYFSGKNPALAILGDLTMAWEHPWAADMYFHYAGGFELLADIYKRIGIQLVGVMWWGMESYPSKKPIRRLEDFKGLKIRVPQGMEADFLTRLGASVIVIIINGSLNFVRNFLPFSLVGHFFLEGLLSSRSDRARRTAGSIYNAGVNSSTVLYYEIILPSFIKSNQSASRSA